MKGIKGKNGIGIGTQVSCGLERENSLEKFSTTTPPPKIYQLIKTQKAPVEEGRGGRRRSENGGRQREEGNLRCKKPWG